MFHTTLKYSQISLAVLVKRETTLFLLKEHRKYTLSNISTYIFSFESTFIKSHDMMTKFFRVIHLWSKKAMYGFDLWLPSPFIILHPLMNSQYEGLSKCDEITTTNVVKLWKYKSNTSIILLNHFFIKYTIHGMATQRNRRWVSWRFQRHCLYTLIHFWQGTRYHLIQSFLHDN